MTHPYLEVPAPVAMAHRGGALEAPENSMRAFRRVIDLGYTHIETDVRATADGVPVVFHDATLDRVTDRVGRIRDLPLREVAKARIRGVERVHSLQEVLDHFPGIRFNIDIKEDNAVEPVLQVLRQGDHLDRVCVASFSLSRLRVVREEFGNAVCTALAPPEVAGLVVHARAGRTPRGLLPRGPVCVQVPPHVRRLRIVTSAVVDLAHARGWPVHVWTIDQPRLMHALLDLGVDGIMTDRPTVLRQVLDARSGGSHGA